MDIPRIMDGELELGLSIFRFYAAILSILRT